MFYRGADVECIFSMVLPCVSFGWIEEYYKARVPSGANGVRLKLNWPSRTAWADNFGLIRDVLIKFNVS